jgi:methionyl-tRNA formyltransferase
MGTPEFAATILERLLAPDSPVAVVGVVTRPDRPVGRSGRPAPPPVKTLAVAHGLPVLQPRSLRRPGAVADLEALHPDVSVVAAYGAILRPDVLAIPPRGHLNVHASLLPRWRGPWPVGAAILAGDAETGVSIMRLDEGTDTGPVLTQRREPVRPEDTTGTLQARLADAGADLLVATLPGYLEGRIVPRPQDDGAATTSRMVTKEDGLLDWSQPAASLERRVRAMQPWPVAWTTWEGKQLRVLRARVVDDLPEAPPGPGHVVRLGRGVAVGTGAGGLVLEQVQLEGRGVVSGAAFVNGYRTFAGSRLGA